MAQLIDNRPPDRNLSPYDDNNNSPIGLQLPPLKYQNNILDEPVNSLIQHKPLPLPSPLSYNGGSSSRNSSTSRRRNRSNARKNSRRQKRKTARRSRRGSRRCAH